MFVLTGAGSKGEKDCKERRGGCADASGDFFLSSLYDPYASRVVECPLHDREYCGQASSRQCDPTPNRGAKFRYWFDASCGAELAQCIEWWAGFSGMRLQVFFRNRKSRSSRNLESLVKGASGGKCDGQRPVLNVHT